MHESIQKLIDMALAEDIGTGDITSAAIVDDSRPAVGRITAKQSLILAGTDVARRVFQTIDPGIAWDSKRADGTRCESGDIIAVVDGRARSLLAGERTALNFLQRLSGIATVTNLFAHAVRDMNVQILDTRKTTPGWRLLEKQAVRTGGGTNHRTGLYDHYLIKNNHIACAGSVSAAISKAQQAKKP
nr:carboxylating nicotinate-nucleotide diphosphorylase [bacterium]